MNAVLVSVDYSDLLAITIPYNRHHFNRVLIITSYADAHNVYPVATANDCQVYATNKFYQNGAVFNKWASLEAGLDFFGSRNSQDWLCIMDADVVWPKKIPEFELKVGTLYAPRRRMWEDWPIGADHYENGIPPESQWTKYNLHNNDAEFAGYSQIFNCQDPVLGPPPWHQINWKHAGGADSFFQMKWKPSNKIRPPFEVLHLGPSGVNWCGRTSAYKDKTVPKEAGDRYHQLRSFIVGRRSYPANDRYLGEKY